MRAFDVLTKAEVDIRASLQPRYHLEMALLRWIHLRRLVPLSDLIQNLEKAPGRGTATPPPAGTSPQRSAPEATSRPPAKTPSATAATITAIEARKEATPLPSKPATAPAPASPATSSAGLADVKEAFLADVQKSKKFFYGTVIAQAQKIEIHTDRVVLTYAPQHRALRAQLDQMRVWLEEVASRIAGSRMSVVGAEGASTATASAGRAAAVAGEGPALNNPPDRQSALKQQALADSGVQAMLDVFAAEIKEVEEM
jgi:DNA polymerase-3 subunit gamma/tau